MPKVSVIMPVYNGEKYLKESIDSILCQTIRDFEFIIIDDGSTDSTGEIIKSYKDPRIVYIKNEKNLGISRSLNKAIEVASGEYIARMDADDISLPNRLKKQINCLSKNKNIGVCASSIIVFGNGQEYIRTFSRKNNYLKTDMLFSCCLAHPTVMIRASVMKKNHLCYNSEFDGMEDYELWIRLAELTGFYCLKNPLLKYRKHTCQITNNHSVEYFKKLKNLKKKQIEKMKIDLDDKEFEAFYKCCKNDSYLDKVEILKLYSAFDKISDSNYAKYNLSKKYLKKSFNALMSRYRA